MPFIGIWTPERDERVRELWAQGLSSSAIARQLTELWHIQVTKNAVIGKVARLKLPKRIKENCVKKHGTPKRRRPNFNIFARRRGQIDKPVLKFTGVCDLIEHPSDPPPDQRIKTPEIDKCAWPFGSGHDISYCGRKRHTRSYCKEHAERAFIPGGRIDDRSWY